MIQCQIWIKMDTIQHIVKGLMELNAGNVPGNAQREAKSASGVAAYVLKYKQHGDPTVKRMMVSG
jgi:hypothetical protein